MVKRSALEFCPRVHMTPKSIFFEELRPRNLENMQELLGVYTCLLFSQTSKHKYHQLYSLLWTLSASDN